MAMGLAVLPRIDLASGVGYESLQSRHGSARSGNLEQRKRRKTNADAAADSEGGMGGRAVRMDISLLVRNLTDL